MKPKNEFTKETERIVKELLVERLGQVIENLENESMLKRGETVADAMVTLYYYFISIGFGQEDLIKFIDESNPERKD